MDLGQFKLSETCEVVIKHPVTKVDTDIVFTIHGADSKKFQAIVHELRNARLNAETTRTSEQIEEDDFKAMHQSIEKYTNIKENKKNVDLTKFEDCKAFFIRHPYIYEQLGKARGERANFL